MSGAAGFLAGLGPAAGTPDGAGLGRARSSRATSGDEAATFAAVLVNSLLQNAPPEVRSLLQGRSGVDLGSDPGGAATGLVEGMAEGLDALRSGPETASGQAGRDTGTTFSASAAGGPLPTEADALAALLARYQTDPAGAIDEYQAIRLSGASSGARRSEPSSLEAPDQDPGKLHPVLQARFEAVRDRMAAEYGHTVELAEGLRSSARQDHLFAQGRSRPGPVVTWTRDSHHETGRAADVTIDGGWDDPVAFQRLQRIAAEEGLVTLGARDPGHLELPASVHHAALPRSSSPATAGATDLPDGGPAAAPEPQRTVFYRPAQVAQVARVATIARPGVGVARPARGEAVESAPANTPAGATPAAELQPQTRESQSAPLPPRPDMSDTLPDFELLRRSINLRGRPEQGPAQSAEAGRASQPVESGRTPQSRSESAQAVQSGAPAAAPVSESAGRRTFGDGNPGEGRGESATPAVGERAEGVERTGTFSLGAAGSTAPDGAPGSTASVDAARPNVAARAEQVAELQERVLNLRGDRVSLRVEHPDGQVTRVRMATGSRGVDAEVHTTDPLHARHLRSDVADLGVRLDEKGLRLGEVAVREPQQRHQGRSDQGGSQGRHHDSRGEWSHRDDSRQDTPWDFWKEELR